MRPLTLALSLLLVTACTGSSPGTASPPGTAPPAAPTPFSSPGGQALAALVDFPNGTGAQSTGYDLSLVATDGRVVARAHAAARAYIGSGGTGGGAALDLPEVSAANGRVYYLDGDQNLRSLTPSGQSSDVIASLPGSPTAHVGFAVSPDGRSVAVSVLTYGGGSATVTSLYVQDLGGGRHDITHSATDLVWPVAWHGADLVLATSSTGYTQQGLTVNPYFATGLELVDPAGSTRVAIIGGGSDPATACTVTGLVVPAGTACLRGTSSRTASEVWLLDWTGARTDSLPVQPPSVTAALNPDQQSTAVCCDSSGAVLVARGRATPAATALKGSPDSWPCWVDDQHLLAGSVNDHQFQPGVLVVGSGTVAQVTDAHGFCAAVLGSAGGAGEPM